MNIVKKMAAAAVAAGTVVAGGVAAATPAAAASPWISASQVRSISNPLTAVAIDTPVGTIQVRHGIYNGRQYGWGRVVNARAGYTLKFEVDTDGDRIPNTSSSIHNLSSSVAWTAGYPTSSSSARAFRACLYNSLGGSCSATNYRTAWW